MLSKENFNFLIGYLLFLLFDGLVLILLALLHQIYFTQFSIGMMSIVGTVGAALVGSSIYYTRRLYQSAMKIGHGVPIDLFERLREMGYYFFYLLRPLYAVSFALIALVTMKLVIGNVSSENTTSGFVYLMVVISFIIGYYSSKILSLFEKDIKQEKLILPTGEEE